MRIKNIPAHLRQVFYITIILFVVAGCNSNTFTGMETELIEKYTGQIMPVLQTSNSGDSLFLRQSAKEFTDADMQSDIFKNLKKQMLLTVCDTANQGVGIAAPQVGISRRLIAVQRFDKENEPFEFYANAYITYCSYAKQTGTEGCLSVPDFRANVERADTIVIKYIDAETLQPCTDTVCGFTAVIFQHEADHLDGVLFTDKINPDV